MPNLDCRGCRVAWVTWHFTKNSARDVIREWVPCCDETANQSPVVRSCNLLNYFNSFCGGMFKLDVKSDADLLLYWLSHFECDSHTVHMLTQQCLLPPVTSTTSEVVIVHTWAFQSTVLGCQVTSVRHKQFS